MNYKRRVLQPGQNVVIIYKKYLGFVQDPAKFLEYKDVTLGQDKHRIPFFSSNNEEISGLDCFWLLATEAKNETTILRFQKQSIILQFEAFLASKELYYVVPEKIVDKRMRAMANDQNDRLNHLIKKLGFDPRDESWVETIAETLRQRNWFKFERESGHIPDDRWNDFSEMFNKRYNDTLSGEEAKAFSKKRTRFLLGAYHTRMSGNSSKTDWATAARQFEEKHRQREERMENWSQQHINSFPKVITKKIIEFVPGPYTNFFLENLSILFVDTNLNQIREKTPLRIISYDPVLKYIRLDFMPDIRQRIKGNEDPEKKIWQKEEPDYDFVLPPNEIEEALDFLDPIG